MPRVGESEWELVVGGGGVERLSGDVEELVAGRKRVGVGLPLRWCQTVAMRLPRRLDGEMRQRAVRMQLEKRGLTGGGEPEPLVAVTEVGDGTGEQVTLSVDVVTGDVDGLRRRDGVEGFWCQMRGYDYPEGVLVLMVEQGEVVAAVGSGRQLLEAQVLGGAGDWGGSAGGLRLIGLALEAAGLGGPVERVEWWGDGGEVDEDELRHAAGGLPVAVLPKPAWRPVSGTGLMLLPEVRERRRGRRRRLLVCGVILAAVAGYSVLVVGMRSKLLRLEAQAEELEKRAGETSGPAEQVKAMGGRWSSFKMLTDPRRYPMVQLENLSRVMPEGGILLERFESKGREISLSCEARDTQAAYEFLNAVTASDELKVMSWSMERPRIDWEGAADMVLKGKAR
ncbi:MAG: hypothetical protein P8J87_08360 [Verrucomicrobiales bacterium]|nr:hypothetical protein [Verrucomicrobiales bacterium]